MDIKTFKENNDKNIMNYMNLLKYIYEILECQDFCILEKELIRVVYNYPLINIAFDKKSVRHTIMNLVSRRFLEYGSKGYVYGIKGKEEPLKRYCMGETTQYIEKLILNIKEKTRKNYTKDHRHTMEAYLGRRLKENEIIHHIDLNHKNNNIDNLLLCRDRIEHGNMHKQLYDIIKDLVEKGFIIFNKEKKEYMYE